jgi:SAM-dependent methyltransferase
MAHVIRESAEPKIVPARKTWDDEYRTHQVIPSSTRAQPSKPLLLFSELLRYEERRVVLDAGSGPGRNAIYLAGKGCLVYALDFSEAALSELRRAALAAGVNERVLVNSASLEEPLPFPDDSFDLALDSYVSCHFTEESLKQHYFGELRRVLKPSGVLFSSQFSVEDEYYRALIKEEQSSPIIVTDPNNGITKQLYTEAEAKGYFSKHFGLRYFAKFEFEDMVLGRPYRRSILTLVLEK